MNNSSIKIFVLSGIAAVMLLAIGCAGTPPARTAIIPDGSYVGRYVRNSEDYSAVVIIKSGRIASVNLKYNGNPLTEPWARNQANLVLKSNSTKVKTVPSPKGRNRAVLKSIDLALQAGIEAVK